MPNFSKEDFPESPDDFSRHFLATSIILMSLEELRQQDPELAQRIFESMMGLRGVMKQPDRNSTYSTTSLGEIRETGEDAWEADTRLMYSDWSRYFAHGADTLMPVGAMLEHILEEDERVTTMESMRWSEIICRNMRVSASLKPFAIDKENKPLMTGSFATSKGRLINIKADDNGERIEYKGGSNPIARDQFGARARNGGQKDGEWVKYPLEGIQHMDSPEFERPGVVMSTAIDLVNYGAVNCVEIEKYDTGGVRLFLGVKNFQLPVITDIGAIRLRPRHDQLRTSPRGFHILPVEAEYLDIQGKRSGGGTTFSAFPANPEAEEAFRQEVERKLREAQ